VDVRVYESGQYHGPFHIVKRTLGDGLAIEHAENRSVLDVNGT
jgi:hypothetical protein